MILPGHIAAGYLTAFVVTTSAGFLLSPQEQIILLGAGALLGDAPDIDVYLSFLKKKTTSTTGLRGHREYVTHAPIIWLILGLLILAKRLVYYYGYVLGAIFFAIQYFQVAA
jgi:hypothetical protein